MGMSLSPKIRKLAYGAVFTLGVPLGLWFWNSRLSCPFPAVQSGRAGAALLAGGGLLMLLAMWRLWREGGGLPMNAFPPPRVATRGIYGLAPHPIYCGFVACCAGTAIASGSATGLWIVTPVAGLACVALVLGYEGPDLRRRFGSGLPAPWLGWPSGDGFLSPGRRLGTAIGVLAPWGIAYWAVKTLGVFPGAVETRLGWEWGIPVLPQTLPVYASIYLAVPLTFALCSDRAEMRRLGISSWLAIGLNTLLYLTLPLTAAFRMVDAHGGFGQWLAWEQRLAMPAAGAVPSFHVTWAVICAAFLAGGPLRRACGWVWCACLCLSCLTTGMHSLADVVAGVLSGAICVRAERLWKWLIEGTERLGNAWKAWRFGPLRVINHCLWAGLAGFLVLLLAGLSAGSGSLGWLLLVGVCALAGAGLWAQWVEGSPALLRPFGYYGAILGGLLALALVACLHGPADTLMAAFAVAAPWTQAVGRVRCIVQGCCHGRPVDWGIRVTNPHSRVVKLAGFSGTPIHPTPLYSILANLVIGLVLWRLRLGGAGSGMIAGLYLVLAGLSRFAEEAYRGEPQTSSFGGLPLYQWMAIGSLTLGMTLMALPGGGQAPLRPPTLSLWIASLLWAGVCAFAMSMDFPASTRRFSRLTG